MYNLHVIKQILTQRYRQGRPYIGYASLTPSALPISIHHYNGACHRFRTVLKFHSGAFKLNAHAYKYSLRDYTAPSVPCRLYPPRHSILYVVALH
jgi:hypothetical protein